MLLCHPAPGQAPGFSFFLAAAMKINDDPSIYLGEFGNAVVINGATGAGILDAPGEIIIGDMVMSVDYSLTVPSELVFGIGYGAELTVDGVHYSVKENKPQQDGLFSVLSLSRLSPDLVAPGGTQREWSLTDLADVDIAGAQDGDQLVYDEATNKWVDATGSQFAYVHAQDVPTATWTINHNLGYRPSVELIDASNREVDGDVYHPTINQTVVMFNVAVAGTARLT